MYARAIGCRAIGRTHSPLGILVLISIVPTCNYRYLCTRPWTSKRPYFFPLQLLPTMSPKQPWATIATVFVLSAVSPSGVWADLQANCSAGWEWVRSFSDIYPVLPHSRRDVHGVRIFSSVLTCGACSLQNRNSLRQDPCLIASILEAACRGQGENFTVYTKANHPRRLPLPTWNTHSSRCPRFIQYPTTRRHQPLWPS